jgi:hypothetical protein
MMPESWYLKLDPGIRFAVRVLHAAGGLETCQSCQGGKDHAYKEPTVEMICGGSDAIGFRALSALYDYGLPVSELSIVWNIKHGLPYEKLWRVTFSKTMEDRANDKPMFVHGYFCDRVK